MTSADRDAAHGVLRIRVAPGADRRRAISGTIVNHGGFITTMQQDRVSLEEAFVQLTGENVKPLLRDMRES